MVNKIGDPKGKIKKKIESKRKLDKKLWSIFSVYVRLRDSNSQGYLNCISCGELVHYKKAHAGHYIPTGFRYIKFNEYNVNGQCVRCNAFLQGNTDSYRHNLIDKAGLDIVEGLERDKHKIFIVKADWYLEMIEYYKKEVDKITKIKGI
uniref:Putative lambda recombination protein n=1 Tax=viral metagenome TaxID=1070528 RepID=A0A6H2A4B5_9ZZZZ